MTPPAVPPAVPPATPSAMTTWMGAAVAGLLVGVTGGGAAHLLAGGAGVPERASVAVAAAIGLAACAAPLTRGGAVERTLQAATGGALAACCATLVAGSVTPATAAVGAGVAAIACGVAAVAVRLRIPASGAHLLGTIAPLLLVAGVFLADPFIEWDGSRPSSAGVARAFYVLNPLAAATSPEGGTGVDWQTRGRMYDGDGGSGGLSRIGQYYPSRPAPPTTWGVTALAVGLLLSLSTGRRHQAA